MSLDPLLLHRTFARLRSLCGRTALARLARARRERRVCRWPLVAAGLIGCGVLRSGLRPGIVVGESMTPTLRAGQWFVLDSRAYDREPPRRGDIVVFRHRGATYIKRVLGVGGDTILMLEVWDADGVWRCPVEPAFLERTRRLCRRDPRWQVVEQTVPAGSLYVMGDMVTRSLDSRHLGPIPIHEVRGRVHLVRPGSVPIASSPPRAALHPRGHLFSKEAG